MPKAPDLKNRKHLHGRHYEPLRQVLEKVLYPVDEKGNRLVDENNEPIDAFPKDHKGCRYHRGHSDRTVAETMRSLAPEEYGYIKYTMVRSVRKEYFGDITRSPKPKAEPVATKPAQDHLETERLKQMVFDFVKDQIYAQNSVINDHTKKINDHRNRIDHHAKSIKEGIDIEIKHLRRIVNLENRVTELETHVMSIGKEAAELASSFRSLQDKLKPVTTSQDVSAIALNKALGQVSVSAK